jgi:hemolysin D
MNITAEIKTAKRRVIEYLLSPVQRAGSESLRDR